MLKNIVYRHIYCILVFKNTHWTGYLGKISSREGFHFLLMHLSFEIVTVNIIFAFKFEKIANVK